MNLKTLILVCLKVNFKVLGVLIVTAQYIYRTNQSQFYFATGLFDQKVALSDVIYDPAVDPHDPVIRFYKVCKKWQKEVKKNPESLEQQRLFEQSEMVRFYKKQ